METKQLESWQENLVKRELEENILSYMFKPFIVSILGSRQVGKTSLLRRLIGNLVFNKNINLSQILYFDFEIVADAAAFEKVTPEQINSVLTSYGADPQKPVFLFIDEIQYHQNPSNLLKVIFDHLPNITTIVTGSSTFKIKTKFKDSLAGRHKTFILHPLSFTEFLEFKNQKKLKKLLVKVNLPPRIKDKLINLVKEYIIFGGYPKVALSKSYDEKISVLESIFTSYVRHDVKDLAIVEETEKFNKLVSLLAFQTGNLLNLTELSNSAGLNRKTLDKYLFILRNTFVISLLIPYYTNRRKELVKSPKIYYQDTGLRNYVVGNFADLNKRVDSGALFENAVFVCLSKKEKREETLRYWRTVLKNEVDFVKLEKGDEPIPFEVKLSIADKPHIPSGVISFIRKYHPKEAFIVNLSSWNSLVYKNTKLKFIPIWALS